MSFVQVSSAKNAAHYDSSAARKTGPILFFMVFLLMVFPVVVTPEDQNQPSYFLDIYTTAVVYQIGDD